MRIGTTQAGGALLIGIGIFAMLVGRTYDVGSLSQMGPGFLPMCLAVALCILGLANIFGAGNRTEAAEGDHGDDLFAQLRSAFFVLSGIVAFGLLINRTGLVVSTVVAAFVVSYANGGMSVLGRIASAVAITALSALLFGMLLPLPVRLFVGP